MDTFRSEEWARNWIDPLPERVWEEAPPEPETSSVYVALDYVPALRVRRLVRGAIKCQASLRTGSNVIGGMAGITSPAVFEIAAAPGNFFLCRAAGMRFQNSCAAAVMRTAPPHSWTSCLPKSCCAIYSPLPRIFTSKLFRRYLRLLRRTI
jgi:hypothetical protein